MNAMSHTIDREKFIDLVLHSKDFIALADHYGRITFMNRGGRQMIGIGEFDDLHEMTFTDSVPLEWQELAGHSDPKLTARYSHRRLYDLAGAVDKLPNLVPSTATVPNASEIPLRMTGTDGDFGVVPGVVPVAVTGGIGLHRTALKYTSAIVGGTSGNAKESLEMKEPALFSAGSHRVASARATGLEPATSGSTDRLQTASSARKSLYLNRVYGP